MYLLYICIYTVFLQFMDIYWYTMYVNNVCSHCSALHMNTVHAMNIQSTWQFAQHSFTTHFYKNLRHISRILIKNLEKFSAFHDQSLALENIFKRKLEYSDIESFHEKLRFADSKCIILWYHLTTEPKELAITAKHGNFMILWPALKFPICIIDVIKYSLIERIIIIMDSQDIITLQLRKRW